MPRSARRGRRPEAASGGAENRSRLVLILLFWLLVVGAVVVESIFSWPGVGRLLVTAVANRDLAVVQDTVQLIQELKMTEVVETLHQLVLLKVLMVVMDFKLVVIMVVAEVEVQLP